MKYFALFALVGIAAAMPTPDGDGEHHREHHITIPEAPRPQRAAPAPVYRPAPPPPAYKPAPAPYAPPPPKAYAPHPEKEFPPQPYTFEYGVADEYTGTNFQAIENQNEGGVVQGSYRVNLPDGRVQTVTYHADHHGGFVADVKYEGEAVYPPEKEYKPAPPAYKPAPPKYIPSN